MTVPKIKRTTKTRCCVANENFKDEGWLFFFKRLEARNMCAEREWFKFSKNFSPSVMDYLTDFLMNFIKTIVMFRQIRQSLKIFFEE